VDSWAEEEEEEDMGKSNLQKRPAERLRKRIPIFSLTLESLAYMS